MNQDELNQILERVDKISHRRTLCDRFVIAMNVVLKISSDRFSSLDGLTRENGQVIYVSADKRKIENSAPNAKAIKLPEGNWYVNASGGEKDFEIIVDSARKMLGLPVGFIEELKRKTILRPEVHYD